MKSNSKDKPSGHLSSRRDFFRTTGQIVAGSALAGEAIPYVQAGHISRDESDIQRTEKALTGPGDNIRVTKIETFVLKKLMGFCENLHRRRDNRMGGDA